MSKFSKAIKKLTNKNTVLGKVIRSTSIPITGSVGIVRAVVKRESITDAVREVGREQFFGVRVREAAAAIGAYYAGAAIAGKGATVTATGSAAAGGAAGNITAGTGAAGGFWSGIGGTAIKTATAGLLLSGLRKVGLAPSLPGEDTPGQSFNVYDPYAGTGPYGGGVFGERTGAGISPNGEETLGKGLGNVLTSPWALIGLGLAIVVFMFAIFRR